MLALVCSGFALSAAALAGLLWPLLARTTPRPRPALSSTRKRWWWRWSVDPVARWLARLIPERWLGSIRAALARADLDRVFDAHQWCAVLLLAAASMAGACLALAVATGLRWALPVAIAAATGLAAPSLALRDRIRRRQAAVLRDLPGYLQLLTLGLEAGCGFGAALQIAVQRSAASPLRIALEQALQEMRAGLTRTEALQRLERRLGVSALGAAVAAIVQAEATGVSLAPIMRAQALRCTQERFARAEKQALEAPVKMLAPLVLCIFPCTFIVIGFPIAVQLLWGI